MPVCACICVEIVHANTIQGSCDFNHNHVIVIESVCAEKAIKQVNEINET